MEICTTRFCCYPDVGWFQSMEADKSKFKDQENLAEDVARLYTLEHVEHIPYRTFSRGQGSEHPAPLTEIPPRAPVTATPVSPVIQEPPATPKSTSSPQPLPSSPGPASQAPGGNPSTAIAIYSLAGGVGKTTIAANLGRIFCSLGEETVLVDTSGSGLLPFYFGASDLRPGLRTFVAPGGSYSPMHVIGTEEVTEEWLNNDVAKAMQLGRRTIFDLGAAATAILPQIFKICAVVLVPLLSDLNSFLTVPRIESLFASMRSGGINVPLPLYVFNKFGSNDPMDQQARSLAIRQIGDRLLSVSIRRSPDIPSAIADRMTVADHAPTSPVSQDFMELALKLREIVPARAAAELHGRWRER